MQTSAKPNARRRAGTARLGAYLLFVALVLGLCALALALSKPKKETGARPVPAATAQAAQNTPQSATDTGPGLDQGTLILVNGNHSIDADGWELVTVYAEKSDAYLVKDTELAVRREVMPWLDRWLSDFAAATGVRDVNVVAGHRTAAYQQQLYQSALAREGQTYADTYLARPGHSEHHTGLAVDLDTYDVSSGASYGFDGNGDYAWLTENAWRYGFILRYPPEKADVTGIGYESWHFRYVGIPHAWYMQENNLCLEEYLDLLRAHGPEDPLLIDTPLGRWQVFFSPAEALRLPEGDYEISGDNDGGYVVTQAK